MSNVALMASPSLGGRIIDKDIGLIGLVPGVAVLVAFVVGILHRREDFTLATGHGRR